MVSLEIHSSGRRRIFQILDEEFSIGSGADLPLNGPEVRERHVRCRLLESGLLVEPEGDVPRLYVNGKSTQGATLRHGDRLAVGTFLLVLVDDDEPAPFVKESWIPTEEEAAAALRSEEVEASGGLALRIELPEDKAAASKARPSAGKRPADPARRRPVGRPKELERKVRGAKDPLAASANKPVQVAASPARSAPVRPRAPERRLPARQSNNSWMVVAAVAGVGVLILLIVMAGGSGDESRKPKRDLVALAESQWSAGEPAAALRTIEMAIEKASGSRRAALQGKREAWQSALLRRADADEISAAQREYSNISRFVRDDLARASESRAANRELWRQCDSWITRYRSLVERHSQLQTAESQILGWRSSAQGLAAPESPDQAEDVLFRVDYLMRFPMRRYREVLESMESYLDRVDDTEGGVREVRKRLSEIRQGGPRWAASERQRAETRWQRGDREGAVGLLRQLVRNLPEEWAGEASTLLSDYSAQLGR